MSDHSTAIVMARELFSAKEESLLMNACKAVVDVWERGDLAKAARLCSEAYAKASKKHPVIPYAKLYKFKHTPPLSQIDIIDDLAKAFDEKNKNTDWEEKDWEEEIVKFLAKELPN